MLSVKICLYQICLYQIGNLKNDVHDIVSSKLPIILVRIIFGSHQINLMQKRKENKKRKKPWFIIALFFVFVHFGFRIASIASWSSHHFRSLNLLCSKLFAHKSNSSYTMSSSSQSSLVHLYMCIVVLIVLYYSVL